VLIMMAGLPGTGKSALARRLAATLGGVVLDKDRVRAALFPASTVDYTTEQDDLVVEIMLQVAAYLVRQHPGMAVLIDGRPFARRSQVQTVVEFAARIEEPLKIIECTCSDTTAKRRLERRPARRTHPARNRNYALYRSMKAHWEPIEQPKLVVNTDGESAANAALALQYIRGDPPA
jgi:adenylylsulfate kinase